MLLPWRGFEEILALIVAFAVAYDSFLHTPIWKMTVKPNSPSEGTDSDAKLPVPRNRDSEKSARQGRRKKKPRRLGSPPVHREGRHVEEASGYNSSDEREPRTNDQFSREVTRCCSSALHVSDLGNIHSALGCTVSHGFVLLLLHFYVHRKRSSLNDVCEKSVGLL